jgi:hypothetical protein
MFNVAEALPIVIEPTDVPPFNVTVLPGTAITTASPGFGAWSVLQLAGFESQLPEPPSQLTVAMAFSFKWGGTGRTDRASKCSTHVQLLQDFSCFGYAAQVINKNHYKK